MGTPYVDSFEENSTLETELLKIKLQEEELVKSETELKLKFKEENIKLRSTIESKYEQHEKTEKLLASLQSKLAVSQPIVEEFEKKLVRLQDEAERAKSCAILLQAFQAFCQSPTKLHEILGDNDDGKLSSSLEKLANTVRNPDLQLSCTNLKTWIQVRVEDRLTKFDSARKKNQLEEMQVHASYICKHKHGNELLSDFVAKLSLRPLFSAARTPPSKEDVPLLFDQITNSLQEGRSTIFMSGQVSANKFIERLIHALFIEEKGIKLLLTNWFPKLDSPPPGIALERCELLALTKRQFDILIDDILVINEGDSLDLKTRLEHLFEKVSQDYFLLEISLLENKYKTKCPEFESETLLDVERLILGNAQEFVSEFLKYSNTAYFRASTFLSVDALEVCLETLSSYTSSRIIEGVVLPLCNLTKKYLSVDPNRLRSPFECAPHEIMNRSFSNQNDQPIWANEVPTINFLSSILIPFVENCCEALETLHEMYAQSIHTLVDRKISLAENEIEELVSNILDFAFKCLVNDILKDDTDISKGEEDIPLSNCLKLFKQIAQDIVSLGDGALSNLILVCREVVYIRIGRISQQKLKQETGQKLAKVLTEFSNGLFSIQTDLVVQLKSPESQAILYQVTNETRQLAHLFVLPKEDILRGGVLLLNRITPQVAANCVQKRSY